MTFYVLVVLVVLNHIAYKGSKVLISLYAMDLGADPFTVGILSRCIRCFPYSSRAMPAGCQTGSVPVSRC